MGAALISGFQEICFLTRQKKVQISRTLGTDHRPAGQAELAVIAARLSRFSWSAGMKYSHSRRNALTWLDEKTLELKPSRRIWKGSGQAPNIPCSDERRQRSSQEFLFLIWEADEWFTTSLILHPPFENFKYSIYRSHFSSVPSLRSSGFGLFSSILSFLPPFNGQ